MTTEEGHVASQPTGLPWLFENVVVLDLVTWPCMVCRDERPDALIAVAHRPAPWFEDQFPETRMNVRYCTDRADCVTIANAAGTWQPPPGDPAERVRLAAAIKAAEPGPSTEPGPEAPT